MDQGLGELFEAVKKSVRSGAVVPSDPEINEAVRTLWEPVRVMQKNMKIPIDKLHQRLYALHCDSEVGENPMKMYVSYLQTTRKAHKSANGLDIEAQRNAAKLFVGQHGGKLIREFIEENQGKKSSLSEFNAALAYAQKKGAVLLIAAEIDNLILNASVLSDLLKSEINFVSCKDSLVNKFTLLLLAMVAEHERQKVASRIKKALSTAKDRGVLLGSSREGHWAGKEQERLEWLAKGRKVAAKVTSTAAREAYRDIEPMIRSWREEGLSLQKIATRLNESGYQTRRGANFTPVQVSNIINRNSLATEMRDVKHQAKKEYDKEVRAAFKNRDNEDFEKSKMEADWKYGDRVDGKWDYEYDSETRKVTFIKDKRDKS